MQKLIKGFALLAVLLLAVDLLDYAVHFKHTEHLPAPTKIPGFFGIYGLVACVALVESAKILRKIVMRDENYYEGEHE